MASRVYRSILSSYLIILLIPILGSPLILYGAGSAISHQMNVADEASVSFLRDDMDERIRNLYSISASLLVSEDVSVARSRTQFDTPDVDVLKRIQTSIQKSISMSSLLTDIYVCFPDMEVILGRDMIFYGEHIENVLSSQMGVSYEEFWSWITEGERKKYVLTGADSTPWQKRLLLFHRLKPTVHAPGQAVVVLHVNYSKIQSMLRGYGASGLAAFSVINQDDPSQTLLSAQTEEQNGFSMLKLLLYRNVEPIVLDSNVLSWTYLIEPSYERFAQQSHMVLYLGLYYVLCFGIGAFLMLVFARRHYTPLQELVSQLRTKIDSNESEHDEYAIIANEVSSMLAQIEHSDQILQSSHDMYQEKLLRDLARGRIPWDLDARLSAAGLPVHACGYYLVLYSISQIDMRLASNSREDEDSSLMVIDQILRRVAVDVAPEGHSAVTFAIDNLIACVMFDTGNKHSDLDSVYISQRKASQYLKEHMQISTNIAISEKCTDLVTLFQTYTEVSDVIRSMGILGMSDQVLTGTELPATERSWTSGAGPYASQMQSQQTLIHLLKAGKFDAAQSFIEQWTGEYPGGMEPTSYRRMEMLLSQMIGIFCDAVSEVVPAEYEEDVNSRLDALTESHDFPAFRNGAIGILEWMRSIREAESKTQISSRDQKIMQYINENYMNQDLNISGISSHFDLSPSYLTRIVRQHTGQNALDYIHGLRIAAAKKLMLTSNQNLQQIAESVGYGTKLNIIRAFKRYEGITPTAWKDAFGDRKE